MDSFNADPSVVLSLLVDRAQREPLLAAWLEAAQWQAAAIAERDNTNEPEPDPEPDNAV